MVCFLSHVYIRLFSIFKIFPLQAILVALKEVHRLRMIISGVAVATATYPDSWSITLMLGAVRGN